MPHNIILYTRKWPLQNALCCIINKYIPNPQITSIYQDESLLLLAASKDKKATIIIDATPSKNILFLLVLRSLNYKRRIICMASRVSFSDAVISDLVTGEHCIDYMSLMDEVFAKQLTEEKRTLTRDKANAFSIFVKNDCLPSVFSAQEAIYSLVQDLIYSRLYDKGAQPNEINMLRLLRKGASFKEISAKLNVNIKMIYNYKNNIAKRVGYSKTSYSVFQSVIVNMDTQDVGFLNSIYNDKHEGAGVLN